MIYRSPDISYIVDLGKKNFEAIGFIPKPRLEEYSERGQIIMAFENDEPCGYLCFGNGYPDLKIYQACIQYDARRRTHGFELVSEVEKEAVKRGCTSVSLHCADDLESNQFWKDAGFINVSTKMGGKRRGRVLNRWFKEMGIAQQFGLCYS